MPLLLVIGDINRMVVAAGYFFSAISIASLSVLVGVGEYLWVRRSSPVPMSWWGVAIVRLLAGGGMFVSLILLILPLEGIDSLNRPSPTSMQAFCGVLLTVYACASFVGLRLTDAWLRRLAYGANSEDALQQWPSKRMLRRSNLVIVGIGALPLLILGTSMILKVRD